MKKNTTIKIEEKKYNYLQRMAINKHTSLSFLINEAMDGYFFDGLELPDDDYFTTPLAELSSKLELDETTTKYYCETLLSNAYDSVGNVNLDAAMAIFKKSSESGIVKAIQLINQHLNEIVKPDDFENIYYFSKKDIQELAYRSGFELSFTLKKLITLIERRVYSDKKTIKQRDYRSTVTKLHHNNICIGVSYGDLKYF